MDHPSSVTQPAPTVEEDDWDTEGFVIPSLTLGDSDLVKAEPEVTHPKPPPEDTKDEGKIYLGPHGAPPSQTKQQELKATGRKQQFKNKLKEADRKFAGSGRENKVESLREVVGGKMTGANMLKSSPQEWLDPHCHESQFDRYSR